ncbi:MAG: right-handed parallel beta-helix repeat-containing protein [Spirochaetota bacterium]
MLEANFIAASDVRLNLVEPADARQFASTAISFSWGATVSGLMTLEVASDAGFSNLVLRKETRDLQYVWQESDQVAGASIATGTYYWRVRSGIKSAVSATRSFFVFIAGSIANGDPLYVNSSASNSAQNGSPQHPYLKISDAIAVSDTLRNGDATKPVRIIVAQGTYNEELVLKPGISLYGGYDASQSASGAIAWARNISANATIVQAPYDNAVIAGADITTAYRATTVVDGLTLRGGSSLVSTRGVSLSNSSPTIRNCTISGGGGTGTGASRIGVNITNGSSPHVLNNIIYATLTAPIGTTTVASIAVTSSSSALIDGNRVAMAPASGIPNCCGLPANVIHVRQSSTATIRNNLILGAGMGWTYGIRLENTSSAQLYNNTIYMPVNGASSAAIQFNSGSTGNTENNVIGTAGGTMPCISELGGSSNATSLRNNNFFGCSNIYVDTNGTTQTMTALCAGNLGTAGCATLLASPTGTGNISIDNAGNQLLVNLTGPDATIYGIADNDWRLTTNAAICDVRGGGVDLSANFTADFLSATRTTALPSGCTPANAGAAGWSMGAYESD